MKKLNYGKGKQPAPIRRRSSFEFATGRRVLRAYDRAFFAMERKGGASVTATSVSAGFVLPDGQRMGERKGYQVFVRLVRFSEAKLAAEPITGGLEASC